MEKEIKCNCLVYIYYIYVKKFYYKLQVRCGRLQKAQALAMHCGQPWRAACLLGWVPNHDPNYSNPSTDTKLPIEGNPNRSLWKMCAWELSQDKRVGNDLSYTLTATSYLPMNPTMVCLYLSLWNCKHYEKYNKN